MHSGLPIGHEATGLLILDTQKNTNTHTGNKYNLSVVMAPGTLESNLKYIFFLTEGAVGSCRED
jgi:hypothetical protein